MSGLIELLSVSRHETARLTSLGRASAPPLSSCPKLNIPTHTFVMLHPLPDHLQRDPRSVQNGLRGIAEEEHRHADYHHLDRALPLLHLLLLPALDGTPLGVPVPMRDGVHPPEDAAGLHVEHNGYQDREEELLKPCLSL